IVTFLQAFEAGKDYLLLPYVMNGNFHHKSIYCRADDGLTPANLNGKTVAMRAYTQTTPTWVRGILGDEYGVDLGSIRWLSQEGAHVAEYEEPSGVGRLDAGRSLPEALLNGEVDAFIAGSGVAGDDRLRGLIPDAAQAALDWHQRTGIVPINHMVAI